MSPSISDLALFTVFMSSVFFTYDLFKMLMALLKDTFQNGAQIMSSVLAALETNDMDSINRAKTHTDIECRMFERNFPSRILFAWGTFMNSSIFKSV